jgi:cytochrome c556
MKLIAICAAAFSLCVFSSIVHADTALETQMKKMADAAHQLGADLKQTDPTKHAKAVDLQSVETLKTGATASQPLEPKKATTLPPDQEKAMNASYQKDMAAFSLDIDQLGTDIQAEKWDVAQTDYQKVMQDEKDGHKAYRVKKS